MPNRLDFLPELGKCPHLVLLDLKLPRVDGLEVLRRMRADDRTRRLPVDVVRQLGLYWLVLNELPPAVQS